MVNLNFVEQSALRVDSLSFAVIELLQAMLIDLLFLLHMAILHGIAVHMFAVFAFIGLAFGHETGLHGFHILGLSVALLSWILF